MLFVRPEASEANQAIPQPSAVAASQAAAQQNVMGLIFKLLLPAPPPNRAAIRRRSRRNRKKVPVALLLFLPFAFVDAVLLALEQEFLYNWIVFGTPFNWAHCKHAKILLTEYFHV